MIDLKNKTALITGGTKGIGKAIGESMIKEGMHVCITGRTQETVNATVLELDGDYPGNACGFVGDVRNIDHLYDAVDMICEKYGQLDVLVANAGIGHFAPIDQLTVREWNEVIDINLTGVFNAVKASVEELKKSQGYIITIASLAGTNFFAKGAAYNASKFGLVGFTQAVMLDLRNYGVKTTTIMPGSVATYFNDNMPTEKDNWKIQPEDLGQMVIDLLKMPARTLPSKVEVRPTKPRKS